MVKAFWPLKGFLLQWRGSQGPILFEASTGLGEISFCTALLKPCIVLIGEREQGRISHFLLYGKLWTDRFALLIPFTARILVLGAPSCCMAGCKRRTTVALLTHLQRLLLWNDYDMTGLSTLVLLRCWKACTRGFDMLLIHLLLLLSKSLRARSLNCGNEAHNQDLSLCRHQCTICCCAGGELIDKQTHMSSYAILLFFIQF